jgi:ribosomal protein S18 acetylase RimI-like enzyme
MSSYIHEKVQIRHLKVEDLPALEWDGEFIHFRRQFEMTYRDYLSGNGIPWIAIDRINGEILGQVFVLFNSRLRKELADGDGRAYMYSIRVKEHVRNLGLGKYMMDVVESDLVERGYGISTLNVARDNPGAYRFYFRLGYRVVAPEPGQWSYLDHEGTRHFVDEPAWRMEKTLKNLR